MVNICAFLGLVALSFVGCASLGAEDNGLGSSYSWTAFADAKAEAASTGKPIMLVITKSWCGACKALKPQFAASAEILELSSSFVMTNVADNDEPSSKDFSPDGGYIPRILFLSSDGTVNKEIINAEGNPQYKYYYSGPNQIVTAMRTALGATATAAGDL